MCIRDSDYTQKVVGKETRGAIRHVSGQELLDGIRRFALNQFGPMVVTVFEEWGVHNCRDFGEIVFNMVESLSLIHIFSSSRWKTGQAMTCNRRRFINYVFRGAVCEVRG